MRDVDSRAVNLSATPPKAAVPKRPPLLDAVRATIRRLHYSRRTEKAYVFWVRRFVLFNRRKHPLDMGSAEVRLFLTDLAVRQKVAASTQNQAFSALLFLYRDVLGRKLTDLEEAI